MYVHKGTDKELEEMQKGMAHPVTEEEIQESAKAVMEQHPGTSWELALLFAQRSADIIKLTRENVLLDALAGKDHLTLLNNKASYERNITKILGRAERYRTEDVSLLFIDLDHFKQVNDQLGHDVGDKALWVLARIMETVMRDTDFLGRYGGEEFVAILPHTNDAEAQLFAERLRKAVEKKFKDSLKELFPDKQDKIEKAVTGTISIGISTFLATQGQDNPGPELLKQADIAMFHSKGRGRNRWTLWAPGMEMPKLPKKEEPPPQMNLPDDAVRQGLEGLKQLFPDEESRDAFLEYLKTAKNPFTDKG